MVKTLVTISDVTHKSCSPTLADTWEDRVRRASIICTSSGMGRLGNVWRETKRLLDQAGHYDVDVMKVSESSARCGSLQIDVPTYVCVGIYCSQISPMPRCPKKLRCCMRDMRMNNNQSLVNINVIVVFQRLFMKAHHLQSQKSEFL